VRYPYHVTVSAAGKSVTAPMSKSNASQARSWLRLLWLLSLLALVHPFVTNACFQLYLRLLLPAAVLIALVDWLRGPNKEGQRADRLIVAASVGVWAFLLGAVILFSGQLAALLDVVLPTAVAEIMRLSWSLFTIGAVFLLLFWRLGFSGRWATAVLVGASSGALLSFSLAYPVYTLLLPFFVPGFYTTVVVDARFLLVNLPAAITITLCAGPFAAWYTAAPAGRERWLAGALSGGAAGIVLFGLLGASLAGLVAAEPLFGVAVSRVGYREAEWMAKWVQAINYTFPLTLAAFWLLLLTGGLLGGLTAGLVAFKPATSTNTAAAVPVWPMGVLIASFPWLFLLSISNVAVFSYLATEMETLLAGNGAVSRWDPGWSVTLFAAQPVTAAAGVQLIGLVWLWRLAPRPRFRPTASCLGQVAGWLGMATLLILLINPGLWRYVIVNAALALGLIVLGIRLNWPGKPQDWTTPVEERPLPDRISWLTAFAAGSLLAAAFIVQTVATTLSLVFLEVSMVNELARETAAPPGAEWLAGIISTLLAVQSRAFLMIMVSGGLVGVFAGWLASLWAPKASAYPRNYQRDVAYR
jgi:hypothetical protein